MVYGITINQDTFAPAKFDSIASILNLIMPLLILFGGILFFVMLLMAAFTFLTGGGNSEKIKKAQNTLINSLIGLVIVISAYLIVKLIGFVFNIDTFL